MMTVKYIGKSTMRDIRVEEGHIFIDVREGRYAEVSNALAKRLSKEPDFELVNALPFPEAEEEQAEQEASADASGAAAEQEATEQADPEPKPQRRSRTR